MAERLDIVIFGATGFTGKRCIPEIVKFSKVNGRTLTWGIAGRSEQKLKDVLEEMEKVIAKDLKSIPVIVADIKDEESLKQMTAKAKVILNCCGPYRFFGEPVIKACVETGTHQLDVTGESQYMDQIQLKYGDACKEKGIYIVSACGFDSIPADLGVIFLENKFEGTLNSVESYLEAYEEGESTPGPAINYGTWETLVHGIANSGELKELRQKLYPQKLPTFTPKLKFRGYVHKCETTGKWALPFLGSDRSVITKTQRFLYEHDRKRPIQIQTYFTVDSLFRVFVLAIVAGIIAVLTKFQFGRNLLLRYPGFFTFGFFEYQRGPSEEKQKKTKFAITFCGNGWTEKLTEPEDNYKQPPNKMAVARVSGTDPAYGITCTALVLSGIIILTETDKLPDRGGVFTPGAAFAKTSLIEKLEKDGLKFEIIAMTEARES
ncbi:saccharopine dehydrogenase-like oxidoreductase [Agrilus planipennis]|uniref:Saccharopine dehydrogenase-like oxidoreductase n=1 Tax=Agrilus planipennis TaxID=224129 RepID=A0A1W4WKW1_AGRPL|nr:saccharopine dehydrogenase-like oxidoreductase [Agrilus planipennis]XP_018320676.1 saccharopine dehydrogenase-like oxidoreductase [Agrilus planipennis]XP_018320677.1 saccharopine dehydrogenase-like oxidoreductase [Agrilus planipennis]XP_018320678.1 saccharopine dehydrogenase-like oxidoreductase [Agrilus planipennis]